MIKQMAVHGWDEVVYGHKLTTTRINLGKVCPGGVKVNYKIRKLQLLAGRQDSDLSKITVPWPVCCEGGSMIGDTLLIIGSSRAVTGSL